MRRAYRSFQFLFKRVRRTAVARLGANLLGDRRGAVAMYAAFVGALLIGGSVLVIDVGRVMVLRAEMQDAADSAALSAVVYLDRSPGAIARATAMAQNGVRHASGVPEGSGNITVATITFFSSYNVGGAMPRGTPAAGLLPTDDAIAAYIEVRLQPETMSMLLQPVLAIFGSGGPGTKTYTTYAVAENSGGAGCGIPPIMVCNPYETGGPSLSDSANIGRMMVIKEGPGKGLLAPGEFGLLCVNGDCGSPVINQNLSSPSAD
ncbi:MAG: pilus assembly protein TadG-related protein, partial [Alphaproteobacteria bacterium]|nr:pilus assembly protein TadG-related protein [Alphaproteobacteria bacterium]